MCLLQLTFVQLSLRDYVAALATAEECLELTGGATPSKEVAAGFPADVRRVRQTAGSYACEVSNLLLKTAA